jgi:hypothetical protein
MAKEKDNRRIVQGVQLETEGEGHVFVPGEEDELEEAMTAEQLEYLKQQGALEGDWSAKGKATDHLEGLPEHVKKRKQANAKKNQERHKKAVEKEKEKAAAEKGEAHAGKSTPPPVPPTRR